MKKVINPCICEVYGRENAANAFVKIEWDGKRLSRSGVVGPMSNGNCLGSAGQCTDSVRNGTPKENWTKEMLDKLCDIWDRWHLNDMHPECEHQRMLGWNVQALEPITKYNYRLKDKAVKAKKAAEDEALAALRMGEMFMPSKEQVLAANLEWSIETYAPIGDELAEFYEPKKILYPGDRGPTETKTRGWVSYGDTDKGFLGRPCPVCGYRYGTAWVHEDVPQDVIDWLFALPETNIRPAWV